MKVLKIVPLALVWCSIVSSLFAHKEMQFSELEEPHKSWHLELFNRVMQATANLEENQQTNFFAVKIVIVFKNGERRIVDIESSYSSSNQSVDGIHQLISSGFICDKQNDVTIFKNNIQTGETLQKKTQISIFKDNYFGGKKQNYIDNIKKQNINFLDILDRLNSFLKDSFFYKLANYCLNEINPFRLADSEMVFLQQMINGKIIKSIKEEPVDIKQLITAQKGDIDHIEIHGFTTRDMCPCCYQHMRNAIQRLRYTYQIPIFAYISSLVKLSQDTLKFVPYGLQDTLAEDDHLTCIFFRQNYDTNFTFEMAKQLAENASIVDSKILNSLDWSLLDVLRQKGFFNKYEFSWGQFSTDFEKGNIQFFQTKINQQNIAELIRSQGFEIRDVTRDGNCGTYALLQGLAYHETAREQVMVDRAIAQVINQIPRASYNTVLQDDNVWNAAAALRQLLPEGNLRREMAINGEMDRWITDDDLQIFSNKLGINIVLISGQNGNRIFMPNGENNPTQQQDLEGVLNFARENNAVILYHNFNHYQTVVHVQNPTQQTSMIQKRIRNNHTRHLAKV